MPLSSEWDKVAAEIAGSDIVNSDEKGKDKDDGSGQVDVSYYLRRSAGFQPEWRFDAGSRSSTDKLGDLHAAFRIQPTSKMTGATAQDASFGTFDFGPAGPPSTPSSSILHGHHSSSKKNNKPRPLPPHMKHRTFESKPPMAAETPADMPLPPTPAPAHQVPSVERSFALLHSVSKQHKHLKLFHAGKGSVGDDAPAAAALPKTPGRPMTSMISNRLQQREGAQRSPSATVKGSTITSILAHVPKSTEKSVIHARSAAVQLEDIKSRLDHPTSTSARPVAVPAPPSAPHGTDTTPSTPSKKRILSIMERAEILSPDRIGGTNANSRGVRDGLAARATVVLRREKSEWNLWKHEMSLSPRRSDTARRKAERMIAIFDASLAKDLASSSDDEETGSSPMLIIPSRGKMTGTDMKPGRGGRRLATRPDRIVQVVKVLHAFKHREVRGNTIFVARADDRHAIGAGEGQALALCADRQTKQSFAVLFAPSADGSGGGTTGEESRFSRLVRHLAAYHRGKADDDDEGGEKEIKPIEVAIWNPIELSLLAGGTDGEYNSALLCTRFDLYIRD